METRGRQGGHLLMTVLIVLVFLFCSSVYGDSSGAEKYQEEAGQIYTTVFHKYKKNVRPPDFYPDPVPVQVNVTLLHIRDLDIMKQELESIIDLKISWQDKRLAWYANKVVMITEELDAVWHPSVVYLNAAVPPKPLFNSKVVISKDGMITWRRREIVTTMCPTEPRNVSQLCDVAMGFTSPETVEVFSNLTEFTVVPDFSNHRWDISGATVDNDDPQNIRFVLDLELWDPEAEGLFPVKNASSLASGQEMGAGACVARGSGVLLASAVLLCWFPLGLIRRVWGGC